MITFWSLVIEHQYHYWLTELSRLQAASVSPLDLPTVGTNAPYEGPSMGGAGGHLSAKRILSCGWEVIRGACALPFKDEKA